MSHRIPGDLARKLSAYGATVTETREIDHATQYRLAKDSETATLNVYSTEKVSEGGKESALKNLLREWRLSTKNTKNEKSKKKSKANDGCSPRSGAGRAPAPNATPRIGTDEAGKGEYFGPLVVAGVRVSGGETDEKLRSLGVRDSKDVGLFEARRLAAEIIELVGEENIRVVCLAPREYESRREAAEKNVNRLLGEMNAGIIAELQAEVEVAIVDAFGAKAREYVEAHLSGSGVRVEARPRAEDDAAVAAASILARAKYLEEMDALSEMVGFELPRGSTHVVEAARRVYEEGGVERLRDAAKVHFSITKKVVA